jgi:hypothetical protein
VTVDEIVRSSSGDATSDRDLAVRLHDRVRDDVRFGFTPWFDHATPAQTLRLGLGHCNPQATLMVTLFRAAGFTARYRPATITNAVLRGIASTPHLLSHVFTEVDHGSGWHRLDSYIVDRPLRSAARSRLRADGEVIGYGCHVDAHDWTGTGDAFSQIATDDLIVELHAPVDEIDDFYDSSDYRHRLGPFRFTSLMRPFRLIAGPTIRTMNARVDALR